MNTTLRVLLVIAIVLSAVQVSALVVALVQSDEDTTNALSGFAAEAVLRWRVYSIGALASLVAGFLVRRRQRLAGDALVIAGVYLLLLANHGGLFAHGQEANRLVTSVLTLAFLLLLALRGERAASGA